MRMNADGFHGFVQCNFSSPGYFFMIINSVRFGRLTDLEVDFHSLIVGVTY